MSVTNPSSEPALDPVVLPRLQSRLARRADTDGLLDVGYRVVDSPYGQLLLAATPAGLVRVAFAREGFDDILDRLALAVSARVLQAPHRLDDTARQLEEYFAGTRRHFTVPLDFRLSRGFRLAVLQHLRHIAYGRTQTYREVATAAGSPAAVRAVGTACATNPLPLVVPCHRVVRSGGGVGEYLGGSAMKQALLAWEARADEEQRS